MGSDVQVRMWCARRVMAALTMVALLASCTTYAGSKRSAKHGAWMTPVGLLSFGGVVVSAIGGGGSREPGGLAVVGVLVVGSLLLPIGGAMLVGGLFGMLIHSGALAEPPVAPVRIIPAPGERAEPLQAVPHAGPKPEAVELHERALAAAQANDCTTVELIAKRVRAVDPEYYEADFLLSVAIRACMPELSPAGHE